MSWPWFKNMYLAPVGAQLTEEQIKSIPYPYTELGVHITYKTVQAGCALGGLAIAPVYRLLSRQPVAVKSRRFRAIAVGGALVGAVVGPAMTVAFCEKKKITHDALYDRSYRLRHNKGQLDTDRLTTVGGLVGFAAAGPFGFVMGVNAGLLARGGYLLYDKFAGAPPPAEQHDEPKLKVDKTEPADPKGNEAALLQTAAQLADEGPIVRADVLDNRTGVSPWLTKWKRSTAPADAAAAAPAPAAAVAPSEAEPEPCAKCVPEDDRRDAAALIAVWVIGAAVLYGLATGK